MKFPLNLTLLCDTILPLIHNTRSKDNVNHSIVVQNPIKRQETLKANKLRNQIKCQNSCVKKRLKIKLE